MGSISAVATMAKPNPWFLSKASPAARKKRLAAFSLFVEQVMGIEPTSKAWEALILPMNYTCDFRNIVTYFGFKCKRIDPKNGFFCAAVTELWTKTL